MYELTKSDRDKLYDFCDERNTRPGSKYPGMSYEDGIMAVLDLLDGNQTVEDIVE